MKLLILIVPLITSSCATFHTPAENRCRNAGLQIEKMDIFEDFNKDQEVNVSCKRKTREKPNTNLTDSTATSNSASSKTGH